jgi:ATP diphosphatase
MTASAKTANLQRLLEIMRALRDPLSGCEWDRQQDMTSLLKHTIEEVYEVADAVLSDNPEDICEELGDLLFQVVFYAQIAAEQQQFDFDDVAKQIADKLVRRHPHVFEHPNQTLTEQELNVQWQRIKAEEKAAKQLNKAESQDSSIFATMNRGQPAFSKAYDLQKRCARVGFDWPASEPVLAKIREELDEVEQAMQSGERRATEEELGDLLFATVNLLRHEGLDPETTLAKANLKFEQRFRWIEQTLAAHQTSVKNQSLEQLEDLWSKAKSATAANKDSL